MVRDLKHGEMHLLPDALFTMPLDGVVVTALTSTENGRVFFTARDGCLYEIEYQVGLVYVVVSFFTILCSCKFFHRKELFCFFHNSAKS